MNQQNFKTEPTEETGEVAKWVARLRDPVGVLGISDDEQIAALLTRLQREKEELEYKVAHREAMFKQREELIRDLQKLASCESQKLEAAERELAAVRKAFTDMFALIDEGWLVRNTAHDPKEGWAMRQVSALQCLAKAKAALRPTVTEKI